MIVTIGITCLRTLYVYAIYRFHKFVKINRLRIIQEVASCITEKI